MKPEQATVKALRAVVLPDGTFGASPLSTPFLWVVSSPLYVIVFLVVLAVWGVSFSGRSNVYYDVILIFLVLMASYQVVRGSRMPEGEHLYRQFILHTDGLTLSPNGETVRFQDIERIDYRSYVRRPHGASMTETVVLHIGGTAHVFRWNSLVSASVPPAFRAGSLPEVLARLGFVSERLGEGSYALTFDRSRAPELGPLTPLPKTLLTRELNPWVVAVIFLAVAGGLYGAVHYHVVTCLTFGICSR